MICIIDCGTSWLEEIKKNLAESGYQYKVIKLNEIEDCDFKSFSGVIISGSPTLLTQVDLHKFMNRFKFIKVVSIPVLGICFGHQIMGLLYGSEIHVGRMINKKEQIEIVRKDDLFLGIKDKCLFKEEHCEFITLPKEFYLLAKSETCNNEAMKHTSKRVYGVQFHPEVSNNNGKRIFRNFLNMCAAD